MLELLLKRFVWKLLTVDAETKNRTAVKIVFSVANS